MKKVESLSYILMIITKMKYIKNININLVI